MSRLAGYVAMVGSMELGVIEVSMWLKVVRNFSVGMSIGLGVSAVVIAFSIATEWNSRPIWIPDYIYAMSLSPKIQFLGIITMVWIAMFVFSVGLMVAMVFINKSMKGE